MLYLLVRCVARFNECFVTVVTRLKVTTNPDCMRLVRINDRAP